MTFTSTAAPAIPQALGRVTEPARQPRPDMTGLVVSCWVVPVLSALAAAADPRLRHWFLIPVTVCGVLIAPDVVDWARGRLDAFAPRALVGLVGLHFFYVAPVLHVLLDHWMAEVTPSSGWRDALGAMATLNAAGLAVYRLVLALRSRPRPARPYRFDLAVFYRTGVAAAVAGAAAFIAVVAVLGGPAGFVTTVTQAREALAGLGWMLIAAESFPLLTFTLVVVRWRRVLATRAWRLAALWTVFAVAQFVVSGVRGSRNNTVWPVLVGLLLIHYLVLRISRKTVVLFAVGFTVFMYAYGLYKGAGTEVLDIARGERTVGEVSTATGRDVPTVLLGDLARADVQAVVLDHHRAGLVEPVYGATYLAAPAFMVPDWLVAESLQGKVAVGTDLLYGSGAYAAGLRSSRVYGLAGEAILNFGTMGGLLSFVALGLIVRFAQRYCDGALHVRGLTSRLLAPSATVLAVCVLSWDADNILWFSIKHVLPIAAVLLVARSAIERDDAPGGTAGPA